ncbi:prephenate dehydratase [Candidatus Halobeggiatoa sp. HSG11]|nr:prephenate dehydratase [Candidatus Halobeggiatoa sp. HSG11]
MPNSNLTNIRTQIDKIDIKIQELITERANLAEEVKREKYALEKNPDFYRPKREAEILRNVKQRNQGPLSNDTLTLIFQEIMSSCLALQKPLKIAFLGPAGTYTQAAVHKKFGHAVQNMPQSTIDEVFREVEAGIADYGVVPVENSTEGGVNQTLECFVTTSLKICGEIELPIHHHLLANSELANIKRIYSHPQSFGQCRSWLDTHMLSVERIPVNSNADAARMVMEDTEAAAIASYTAAEIYQLDIIASRIEDEVDNTTRFAVLGQQDVPSTGNDKTSLLLSNPNKSGTLYHLLEPFAKNDVNMTRIESRPSQQGIWEYVFFVDIEGHIKDEKVAKSLKVLEEHTSLIKLLGSYPCT